MCIRDSSSTWFFETVTVSLPNGVVREPPARYPCQGASPTPAAPSENPPAGEEIVTPAAPRATLAAGDGRSETTGAAAVGTPSRVLRNAGGACAAPSSENTVARR